MQVHADPDPQPWFRILTHFKQCCRRHFFYAVPEVYSGQVRSALASSLGRNGQLEAALAPETKKVLLIGHCGSGSRL